MRRVQVQVLHMQDCPATPGTIRLVEDVARSLGVAIEVERLLVETAAQAQALRFLGSPTVRVAGREIDPEAADRQDFGLT